MPAASNGNDPIDAAILKWIACLGPDHALTDAATLERYGRSTQFTDKKVSAVLLPGNLDELRKTLAVAATHRICVYPVSRGKNWGYGSASPVEAGDVVIDLHRMDRILEINEKLAYAVVEPGVTPQQLFDHLKERNIPLFFDVTGGPPSSSFIGNIVERGYGQTLYSDHFLHSAGMEVLLADGQLLETGFGHYAGAKARHLYKWGVGPFLDGLFTQSNFGIVTKIGIWLMPKPEDSGLFYFHVNDDARFGEVIEKLRRLRLDGTLTSAVHIFNETRIISSLQQYPWDAMKGQTPLADAQLRALMKKYGLGSWNCSGGLAGSRRKIRLSLSEIRRAIDGLADVHFISSSQIEWAWRHPGAVNFFKGSQASKQLPFLGLARGIPTEQPSLLPYWRKKTAAPAKDFDPVRDRCGLVWCVPVVPSTREDVLQFTGITRTVFADHGFEVNVSINLITERALSCIVGIVFDKENAEETKKAAACHDTLLTRYLEAGYVPYRAAHDSMAALIDPKDPFWIVCRRIKDALDPGEILAPGRYSLPKS